MEFYQKIVFYKFKEIKLRCTRAAAHEMSVYRKNPANDYGKKERIRSDIIRPIKHRSSRSIEI